MNTILREPLLHFLLLGGGLFALHGCLGGSAGGEGGHVVITSGKVEQLASGFARMHQRQPDSAELKALVDDAVREEIYYREAKALALDADDTIVRRRLRQKLEFISEDLAPIVEPDDIELQAFLQAHPDRFGAGRRYSFSHAYLGPGLHDAQPGGDAGKVLQALRAEPAGDAAGARGDPFLLAARFDDIEGGELARLFGDGFEARLRDLHIGEWQGPIPSAYGNHLVLLDRRVDGQPPALATVRSAVREQWKSAQRVAANEKFYADLRSRYAVTVEGPAGPGAASGRIAGALP